MSDKCHFCTFEVKRAERVFDRGPFPAHKSCLEKSKKGDYMPPENGAKVPKKVEKALNTHSAKGPKVQV